MSAAIATPQAAPSALAPVSPSIDRSARSSGSSAVAAPVGPARTDPEVPALTTGYRRHRDERPWWRAPAAGRAGWPGSRCRRPLPLPEAASTSPPRPRRATAPATSPVAARPKSFTVPVVTSPCRRAPRCPRRPLTSVAPVRSSTIPSADAPPIAIVDAARTDRGRPGAVTTPTSDPSATAGPCARVTLLPPMVGALPPRRRSDPPGGRRTPLCSRPPLPRH